MLSQSRRLTRSLVLWIEVGSPFRGIPKTREWKTLDQIAWMENAELENAGPNFTGEEEAGPPSMEREMDKYKCIM